MTWLLDHPAEHAQLRTGARQEFEAKYTAESGLKQLLAAYQRAIAVRHRIPARAEATRVPS